MTRLHPDDIQAIAERVVLLMAHPIQPAAPAGSFARRLQQAKNELAQKGGK